MEGKLKTIQKVIEAHSNRQKGFLLLTYFLCFIVNSIGLLLLLFAFVGKVFVIATCVLSFLQLLIYFIEYVVINLVQVALLRRHIKKEDFNIEKEETMEPDELPIIKIIRGDKKNLITDRALKNFFACMTVSLIFIIIAFAATGYETAQKQNVFDIIADNGTTYAVIYNNSEDLVLKKAIIDNNTIEIDLSEQKVISAKEVTMKKYKFETVNIIPVE